MTMNSTGRPTSLSAVDGDAPGHTVSGSKGLLQMENLIFEIGSANKTGVDLAKPKGTKSRLGGVTRTVLKPTHMIGGYVQLAYGFNYYGTVGSNRDEFVIVRKMDRIDWMDSPLPATGGATA